MSLLQVYHFHNGQQGGVWSVISNLLRYNQHPFIQNHVIFCIEHRAKINVKLPAVTGASSVQFFYYSANWNFYYTCKKMASLLPDQKAVVVAHDWPELGMMSNLGLQNPVVQWLHGDYSYYYTLAVKHQHAINRFVTVSAKIAENLCSLLPHRKAHIQYLRFPVPAVQPATIQGTLHNIIFIGRLSTDKGYPLLRQIDSLLASKSIFLQWHIVGEKPQDTAMLPWADETRVIYYGAIGNQQLLNILPKMHLFILPSLAEGMPVTLAESMKAGLIPLVNNLGGGIAELIIPEQTGFLIEHNSIEQYATAIRRIITGEVNAAHISQQAMALANQLFDAAINTQLAESVLQAAATDSLHKMPEKVYGSRLDKKWMPNFFTAMLRKFSKNG
jgi:glycosyltransferase involved in cell wall biosynthesis